MGTYSNSRFSYYERNRNSCALQKGLSDRTESRMYPRIAVRLDASKPERKLEGVTNIVMRVITSENDTPLGDNLDISSYVWVSWLSRIWGGREPGARIGKLDRIIVIYFYTN